MWMCCRTSQGRCCHQMLSTTCFSWLRGSKGRVQAVRAALLLQDSTYVSLAILITMLGMPVIRTWSVFIIGDAFDG